MARVRIPSFQLDSVEILVEKTGVRSAENAVELQSVSLSEPSQKTVISL